MKIKVCGNTLPQQVNALDEIGVTFAGFIFYPKSPRYMAQKISPEKMRQIKGKIIKVGVFVNPTYEELMKAVEEYRLDMVQLHGDENPKFCDKIADYIPLQEIDNGPATLGVGYGGTGKKFDWTLLQQSLPLKPYFLSGGIESGDEKKLEEFIGTPAGEKLFAIDINTKFEIGPGVKDVNSIKKFAENLGIKKPAK